MSLLADEFTKSQLPDIAAERSDSWGENVLNRQCYQQWAVLARRLGMTPSNAGHIATLRKWMETAGPIASVGRGVPRDAPGPSNRPGPSQPTGRSRVRRHDDMTGRTRDDDRSDWVRGRYQDRSRSRSGSRSRGSSLNRGSSGRYQR